MQREACSETRRCFDVPFADNKMIIPLLEKELKHSRRFAEEPC
jgi:hypothetical protein